LDRQRQNRAWQLSGALRRREFLESPADGGGEGGEVGNIAIALDPTPSEPIRDRLGVALAGGASSELARAPARGGLTWPRSFPMEGVRAVCSAYDQNSFDPA
jgi:hypothetical protein